jgi:hypothetical protein
MPARLPVIRVNLEMDPHRKSLVEPGLPERREMDSLKARSRVARLKVRGP